MNDGDDADRARDLARRYGSEFVDLSSFPIEKEQLAKVPVELMFRYSFVPIKEMQDGRLEIAIADPSQLLMIDEIQLFLNRPVVTVVSTLRQIGNTLTRVAQQQGDKCE